VRSDITIVQSGVNITLYTPPTTRTGEVNDQCVTYTSFKPEYRRTHRGESRVRSIELDHNVQATVRRVTTSHLTPSRQSGLESLNTGFAVYRQWFQSLPSWSRQWLKITRIARILWDVKWSWGWHPWDHHDDRWLLPGYGVGWFCLPGLAQPFQRATEQMAGCMACPGNPSGYLRMILCWQAGRVSILFNGKEKGRSEILRQRVTITYRYTNDDLLNLLWSLLRPYITRFKLLLGWSNPGWDRSVTREEETKIWLESLHGRNRGPVYHFVTICEEKPRKMIRVRREDNIKTELELGAIDSGWNLHELS
jgi:hypothetical protein